MRALLDSKALWLLLVAALLPSVARRVQGALRTDLRFTADPARLELRVPDWAGPRVQNRIQDRLRRLGPVNLFDPAWEGKVRDALEREPCVAGVHNLRRVWPNRFTLGLRFHRPVALVRHEWGDTPVTDEGVALPARPFVHLLGELFVVEGVTSQPPRPGRPWKDARLLAGLLTLRQVRPHLNELALLGLNAVDVAGAFRARTGVVLKGADGLRVLWGRPSAHVGENPVDRKIDFLRLTAEHARHLNGRTVELRFGTPRVVLHESEVQ